MLRSTWFQSPAGPLRLASDGDFITRIDFTEAESFPVGSDDEVLRQGIAWLEGYFAGHPASPDTLPLCPVGTPFQKIVWSLLTQIPWGRTVTYGALAKQVAALLGKPAMSAQAIGQAVGRNPIAIAIPCHRVIGADGSLTGYAGGLHHKRWLLTHEGVLK